MQTAHLNAETVLNDDDKAQQSTKDESEARNGSLRKRLAGKTYHHIKDIFTTKFISKSGKKNGPENSVTIKHPATAPPSVVTPLTTDRESTSKPPTNHVVVNETNQSRQSDTVHSINQRIHSQIAGQNQVWGSYGRSSKIDSVSSSEMDCQAIAKMNLNVENDDCKISSPYTVRQTISGQKPSVTFRMDLNECQYNSMEESASSIPYAKTSQGQIILYDDTMHFPQQRQQCKPTNSNEHDSTVSSIASVTAFYAPQSVRYACADHEAAKTPPYQCAPTEGLSSGHQSTGSWSDLDKRSGQSVSTNDSGLDIVENANATRNRSGVHQLTLDTSTENEVFLGRQTKNGHHWLDAADHEVKSVMETRHYHNDDHHPKQIDGFQSTTPPLPPLSPDNSPKRITKIQKKFPRFFFSFFSFIFPY